MKFSSSTWLVPIFFLITIAGVVLWLWNQFNFQQYSKAAQMNYRQAARIGVLFDEPQPLAVANENVIPKNLQGLYQSKFDSSYLTITAQGIIQNADSKLPSTLNDTLFFLPKGDVIRKMGSAYLLNTSPWADGWLVSKLEITEDGILLGSISGQSYEIDLKNIRAATATTSDTVYRFNPTVAQFQNFLNQNGFSDIELFAKVK